MRKKLLSLFVVFCMLLGMVPAIFANEITDALGIKEEDVSRYVSENTVLTENVEGLVLVTAPVRVTIDGAKLATGIVLAPSAGDATVTITNAADVNAVVVLSEATVTIEASAAVANIDVSAANADVEVAGTVGSITVEADAAGAQVVVAQAATVNTVAVAAANVSVDVAGTVSTVSVAQTAASAKVTVEQTATVSTVSVAGSNASVDVAGSVRTVTVSQTAASANINVEKSATVSNVNVAAENVTVEVSGTVENVNVSESATGAQLVVDADATVSKVTDATGELDVSGSGSDNVTVSAPADDDDDNDEPAEEPADTTPDNNQTPDGEQTDGNTWTGNEEVDVEWIKNIKKAPLEDHSSNNKETGSITSVEASVTKGGIKDKEYDINISGNVKAHQGGDGADNTDVKWVGIAIPKDIVVEANNAVASADTSADEQSTTTKYYFFIIYQDGNEGYKVEPLIHDNETDDGNYTYYFNGDNADVDGKNKDGNYYRVGVIKEEDLKQYLTGAAATADVDADTSDENPATDETQSEEDDPVLKMLAGLLGTDKSQDLVDGTATGEESFSVDDVLDAFDYILHIKYDEDDTQTAVPDTGKTGDEDEGGQGGTDRTITTDALDEGFYLGTVEEITGSTEDVEDAEDAEEAEGAEIDLLFPAFDLAVLPVPVIEAPAVEAAMTTEAPVEEPEEEAEPEETEETEDEAVEEAEEPEIEAEEPAED